LAGSGLLIRSFLRLKALDLGFNPGDVLTMRVQLSEKKYPSAEKQVAFFSQLLENAKVLPGVHEAAIASGLPLIGSSEGVGAVVDDRPAPPPGGAPVVPLTPISPEYFGTVGIPVLRGRLFAGEDREGAPPVVIVNQAFAREFFPGKEAIGNHLKFGSVSRGPWYEIVGIVGNVRQGHLRQADPPNIYVPYRQHPDPNGNMLLVLKGARRGLPSILESSKLVYALDPDQPVDDIATMDMRLAGAISTDRANMTLMGIFAAVALALAAIGIFGVIAYFVGQRAHEIGVRMALGAQPADILWMVLRPGAAMTITGIAIGLLSAFVCTRVLRSLLFGISTTDLTTLVVVSTFFLSIAMVACYIPASRAARLDPNEVLRCEG
jgi:putative ABC transport system permease protein